MIRISDPAQNGIEYLELGARVFPVLSDSARHELGMFEFGYVMRLSVIEDGLGWLLAQGYKTWGRTPASRQMYRRARRCVG